MSRFAGAVTIVDGDGAVIADVEASLVGEEPDAPGYVRWFGVLKGDFDAFDLMEGAPSLRLPDGREAPFRLARTDLVLPRKGIDILGQGEPPF
ncbi:hypothetical protein BH18ACT4_BH18ACT4_10380 [soil metagenome]